MCRVPYSACINGTCQCHDGYEIANNLCKPFPFGNVAILGEECGGLVNCAGHHMTCKENRCRCEDGFRNATKEELALFPFILQQCLPESFKPGTAILIESFTSWNLLSLKIRQICYEEKATQTE